MAKYATVGDDTVTTLTFGPIADGEFLKRVGGQISSAPGTGGVAFGAITGEVSTQTNLQSALDAKAAITSLSSAAYTILTDYATSTQEAKADSAIQAGGISSAAYTLSTIYASSTHTHSASAVTASTFATARMGVSTANVSTFLDGTGTWSQPVYTSLSSLPTLGTSASTNVANYASSTHNISSATHTFPGGTTNFLREDGTFATPVGGSSPISTMKTSTMLSSTTTTALSLDGLGFTVSSGVAYGFEFGVAFASVISTTGLKIGLTTPTFSTFTATVRIPIAAAGTGGEFQGWISSSGGVVTGTAIQVAGTKYYADIEGAIIPTNNGTLQVIYGTEVAGSAISTFAGSYGILTTL